MKKDRRGQEGQFLIEGILLMTVMIMVVVLLTRLIKDSELATGLITKPWSKVAGMMETGTWNEIDDTARKKHPNTYDRFFTPN